MEKALIYLVTVVLTYYWTSLVQTVFHRAFGHRKRIHAIYRSHMVGHHAQYRGRHMLSERYLAPAEGVGRFYLIPALPVLLAVFLLVPLDVFVVHVVSLVMAVRLHYYLHEHYHLEKTWLSRFAWFRAKRRLHWVHHRKPETNMAIIEYFWDRVLGTYEAPDERDMELDRMVSRAGAPRQT